MNGLWYTLLNVFVQTTLFASALVPGEISEAVTDAVTEVAGRRLGGPPLESGAGPSGCVTFGRVVGAGDELGGVASPGSGSEAVNTVYMYALFNRRGEAPQAVTDFGYAEDISTTATAFYAQRLVYV